MPAWLVLRGLLWTTCFPGANLFVTGYEEPALRRRFGASYDEYAQRVGRPIPKRPSGDARS